MDQGCDEETCGGICDGDISQSVCEAMDYDWFVISIGEGYFNDWGQVNYAARLIKIGDIDGDNDTDFITGDQGMILYKFVNNGSNSFTKIQIGSAGRISAGAIVDIDNDDDLDIFTGDDNNQIYWWDNNGSGTFTKTLIGSVGNSIEAMTVGYVDADSNLDLIIGDNDGNVWKWINNGSTTFTGTNLGSAGGFLHSVTLSDMDGDDDMDIISSGGNWVYKWINNGAGGFTKTSLWGSGISWEIHEVGDLDGDGDIDFVVGDAFNKVNKFINNGAASFTRTQIGSLSGKIYYIDLDDMDNDGDLDIITGTQANPYLHVWVNDGSANFGTPVSLNYSGDQIQTGDVGDLDQDGDLEIIVGSWVDKRVREWHNTGIQGVNGACCGDDAASDDFYNASNGYGGFCYDGNYYYGDADSNQNACELIGYTWLSGSVAGSNGPCCGDDAASDDFYNASNGYGGFCYDGTYYYGDADSNQNACELRGDTWFSGTVTGSNGPCCGDDGFSDVFYNSSQMCSYGGIILDADHHYYQDWLGDHINYTSGKGICELKDYTWFASLNSSFSKIRVDSSSVGSHAVVIGDIDGDGDMDIIGGREGGLYKWVNDGSGGFTETNLGSTYQYALALGLGDIDGDGDLDVITGEGKITTEYLGIVRKWVNDGSGGFTKSDLGTVGNWVWAISLGDIDGDGDLDIISGNWASNTIYKWVNDGSGGFTETNLGSCTRSVRTTALGDIDGDGDLDIVNCDNSGGADEWFYTWFNDGSGGFTKVRLGTTSGDCFSIALGDMDADGDIDAVVGSGSGVRLWTNNGTGYFTQTTLGSASGNVYSVAVGDINNDGYLDIASGDTGDHVYKWINNGTGGYTSTDLGTGANQIRSVAFGDLDGDGDLEIVSADAWTGGRIYKWTNLGINGTYGPCCGDDAASDDFYNSSRACYNGSPSSDRDAWQTFCEAGGYTWLSGSITGSNGPCCGDDAASDDFYNGTLGSTTYFCKDGSFTHQSIDFNQTVCEQYSYNWINVTYGLVSHWRFDESSGTTASDDSGVNDGTLYNMTDDEWVSGKYGNALEFNGSNKYVSILDSDSLSITGNLTITAWLYPKNMSQGRQTVVFKHHDYEYEVTQEPSGLISFYHGNGTYEEIEEPAGMVVTEDQWNHIVITRDMSDNKIKFYLNGSFIGEDEFIKTPAAGSDIISIGCRYGAIYFYNGTIDDIRIYNHALSADEITALYKSSAYSNCCGDDAASDDFYNGTIGSTTYFCKDGSFTEQAIDVNQTICEQYSYIYFTGTTTGNNDACCGDDGASDDFYNGTLATTTYFCQDGVFTEQSIDFNQTACEASGYIWLSGTTTGSNDACCGDDDFTDIFYNSSQMCSYGGIILDADHHYYQDWFGDYINYTSGQGVCELKGYEWFTGGGTFDAQVTSSTGVSPMRVAIGDLNNDGNLDIVTVNYDDDTYSFLAGNGDGTFDAQVTGATGTEPYDVAIGDLDNDGNLDIVVTNGLSNTYSFISGNGDGTFDAQVTGATGSGPAFLALGDLDKDGNLDIVTANYNDNNVSFISGNGDGTFDAQVTILTGWNPFGVAIGDLDKDGNLDIVVTNNANNTYSFLAGNGDGTFDSQVTGAVGNWVIGVAIGDLDKDGNLDIVTANYNDNNVSFISGNGDGTFDAQVTISVGTNPLDIALGDLNNDGNLDIVTVNYDDDTYSFLAGNGDGTFDAQVTGATGAESSFVALGDLNEDGILDIVVTNYYDDTLSFIENTGIIGSKGPCCGDDTTSDDFYNSSRACYNGSPSSDRDAWQTFCEAGGYTWLTGSTIGNNTSCCGDDTASDDFYNGTLATTTYFCHDGVLTEQAIDVNQTICEYYGYTWLAGATATGSRCCGDDGDSDDFGNLTLTCCCNGAVINNGGTCDFDNDGNIDAVCENGRLPGIFISASDSNSSYLGGDFVTEFLIRNSGDELLENLTCILNTTLSYIPNPSNPTIVRVGDSGLVTFDFGTFSCADFGKSYNMQLNCSYSTATGGWDELLKDFNFTILNPLDISSVSPGITTAIPVALNEIGRVLVTLTNLGNIPVEYSPATSYDNGLLITYRTGEKSFNNREFNAETFSILPGAKRLIRLTVLPLSSGERDVQLAFTSTGACPNITDSIGFQVTVFTKETGFFGVHTAGATDYFSFLLLLILASLIVYRKRSR